MIPKTIEKSPEKIERRKALAIAYETVWKVLASRNRLEILFALFESERTWSDLMFFVQINPRSLSAHLKYLQEYHIVEKKDKTYYLTELGIRICELNFFHPEYLQDIQT